MVLHSYPFSPLLISLASFFAFINFLPYLPIHLHFCLYPSSASANTQSQNVTACMAGICSLMHKSQRYWDAKFLLGNKEELDFICNRDPINTFHHVTLLQWATSSGGGQQRQDRSGHMQHRQRQHQTHHQTTGGVQTCQERGASQQWKFCGQSGCATSDVSSICLKQGDHRLSDQVVRWLPWEKIWGSPSDVPVQAIAVT